MLSYTIGDVLGGGGIRGKVNPQIFNQLTGGNQPARKDQRACGTAWAHACPQWLCTKMQSGNRVDLHMLALIMVKEKAYSAAFSFTIWRSSSRMSGSRHIMIVSSAYSISHMGERRENPR